MALKDITKVFDLKYNEEDGIYKFTIHSGPDTHKMEMNETDILNLFDEIQEEALELLAEYTKSQGITYSQAINKGNQKDVMETIRNLRAEMDSSVSTIKEKLLFVERFVGAIKF